MQSLKARTLGLVMTALLLCAGTQTATAGDGQKIVRKVLSNVELLEDDYNETIASVQIDQLTTTTKTRSYTRYLYSGNKYTSVAVGDDNFTDVDMVVYRKSGSSWIEVDKDADTSNTCVVIFDCKQSGDYKFEIKAYKFASGSTMGYYGFVLSY